ncbi:hypothetical protein F5888DRAFT_1077830 [Russula emetica]|nr:hypothetical protein F5888DRAFT_1077830 [Russula emetica]
MASQLVMPGSTSYHNSSANVSATPSSESPQGSQESPTQSRRLQSEMKALIENELKDVTYCVDLTTEDGILYADPRTVEAVVDSLGTTFHALTSGGDSSPTNPRFPVDGFPHEPQSYEPLVHLLNKIIDTVNRYTPRSQLSELRFHPFGSEVKETYDNQKGLKPGGVGIIGELSTEMEEPAEEPVPVLSWERIEVIVESKASVRKMVRKSATCARCCLLSNQRRFFALCIGFHYIKLEAYVFVFHRSGLSSSRPLKVTTGEGFRGLVGHIVGILSFKDEAAYGLDTTRFQNMFRINNRYYEIVRLLYMHGSLRGRSTIVYSLQAAKDIPQRDLESRMLTLSGVDHLPDKLTYKQTYQIKGHSHEGLLLSQFNGQFGIVDVIGYHDCGTEDPHGSTRRLLNDAVFWRVFGQQDLPEGRRHEPEERGLQCIALSGEGKDLMDLHTDGGTPSPGELLESILHAIIGHYNLFDKGILHRDISSGNILRNSVPVRRPALDK